MLKPQGSGLVTLFEDLVDRLGWGWASSKAARLGGWEAGILCKGERSPWAACGVENVSLPRLGIWASKAVGSELFQGRLGSKLSSFPSTVMGKYEVCALKPVHALAGCGAGPGQTCPEFQPRAGPTLEKTHFLPWLHWQTSKAAFTCKFF